MSFLSRTGRERGSFWIDTLCVSLEHAARKKALSLIRETFYGAHYTIILDLEIEQFPSVTQEHDLLWRLAVSDWARRLWTYEKFVVSGQRTLVKCRDGLIDITWRFGQALLTDNRPGLYPGYKSFSSNASSDISSSSAEHFDDAVPSGAGVEYPSSFQGTEESLCSPSAGLIAAKENVDCPGASLSDADFDNEDESSNDALEASGFTSSESPGAEVSGCNKYNPYFMLRVPNQLSLTFSSAIPIQTRNVSYSSATSWNKQATLIQADWRTKPSALHRSWTKNPHL